MGFQDIVQLIKGTQDPRQLSLDLLKQKMGNTPMGENLLALAKEGKTEEIEKIARNLCQQRGVDYDKEFSAFKQLIGVK